MADLTNTPATGIVDDLLENYQSSGEAVVDDDISEIQFDDEPQGRSLNAPRERREYNPGAYMPTGLQRIGPGGGRDVTEEAISAGFGSSRYDKEFYPGMDLEQARAVQQTNANKIVSGAGKMLINAGSVFLDTVAGTVAGAVTGAAEAVNQIVNPEENNGFLGGARRAVEAGVNNPVSQWLNEITLASDEWFPNYRTQRERSEQYQREWYKPKNWTANFIGDNILKNFGFTLGAVGGGIASVELLNAAMSKKFASDILKTAVVASAGDAEAANTIKSVSKAMTSGVVNKIDGTKLAGVMSDAAKKLTKSQELRQIFGATMGAMSEGRIEGAMAKREYLDDILPRINEMHREEYDSIEQSILDSGNIFWVDSITVRDENGDIHDEKQLTPAGEKELARRREEVNNKYARMREEADDLGEQLSTATYLLNQPILIGSNLLEFGRAFAGGWKTQRAGLRSVTGSLIKKQEASLLGKGTRGALTGELAGKGSVAGKAIRDILKVGGTEGAEEMIQGFVSSGTKNVADTYLAKYNHDAYDDDARISFAQWFDGIVQGGYGFINDITNWQEGALGALTGLIGVPGQIWRKGQRWQGGVYGAIRDAKKDVNMNRAAAETFNSRISDKSFRDRWEGYIRGLKYQDEMNTALIKNDEYAWHNAEDKLIINDVITFAKVGRLDELRDLAKSYSEITIEQAKDIKNSKEANPKVKAMSPEQIVQSVKERGEKLANVIEQYGNMYDAMSARAPLDTSDEYLSELVFTAMQIDQMEDRFFKMYDEITEASTNILDSDPSLSEKQVKGQVSFLRNIFSSLEPQLWNKAIMGQINANLNLLKNAFSKLGNKEMIKKIDDMLKLAQDRAEFYQKLQHLQTISGQEEFENEKITPQKQTQAAQNAVLKKEVETFESVEDVRNAYNAIPVNDEAARQRFMQDMRNARKDNPYVDEYLRINSIEDDFRQLYNRSSDKPSDDGLVGTAAKYIRDKIFENASRAEEIYDEYASLVPGRNIIKNYLRGVFGNQYGDSQIEEAIDEAKAYIKSVIDELVALNNYHSTGGSQRSSAFGNIRQGESQQHQQRPTAFGNLRGEQQGSQGASTNPVQAFAPNEVVRQPDGSITDVLGRSWKVGQTVYLYNLDSDNNVIPTDYKECKIDSFNPTDGAYEIKLSITGNTSRKVILDLSSDRIVRLQPQVLESQPITPTVEQDFTPGGEYPNTYGEMYESVEQTILPGYAREHIDEKTEAQGVKQVGYYNQSIPEIDSFKAKDAREIVASTASAASKRSQLSKMVEAGNLDDFYIAHPEYKDTWQALANWRGQNGFKNIATELKVNDKVVFVYDPTFPKDSDGKDQFLVMLDSDSGYKILTVLHADTNRNNDRHPGLSDLHEKIKNQKDLWTPKEDRELFVFRDKEGNPYRSNVFMKRSGFVVYGKEEKSIKDQALDADPDAPIYMVSKGGVLTHMRGAKIGVDRTNLQKLVNKLYSQGESNPTGNLYYLAKGNNGTYSVPIRLNVEHYNQTTMTYSSPVFSDINTKISAVANAAKNNAEKGLTIDEIKDAVHEKAESLGSVLDIHSVVFDVYSDRQSGIATFAIYKNGSIGSKRRTIPVTDITSDWLQKQLAYLKLSVNIVSSTDIDELIDSDIITTNATLMRPKGFDFYFDEWDAEKKDFVTPDIHKQIAAQEVGSSESVVEEQEDTSGGIGEVKIDIQVPEEEAEDDYEDEEGEEVQDKRDETKRELIEGKTDDAEIEEEANQPLVWKPEWRNWDSLPEKARADLESAGITKEKWAGYPNDAFRKKKLGCL